MAVKSLALGHTVVSGKARTPTQVSTSKAHALGLKASNQYGLFDTFPAPGPVRGAMAERQEIPPSQKLRVQWPCFSNCESWPSVVHQTTLSSSQMHF